jgi:hypothetical protein
MYTGRGAPGQKREFVIEAVTKPKIADPERMYEEYKTLLLEVRASIRSVRLLLCKRHV